MGLLMPIIILIVCGHLPSISNSWGTELQPLFIFVNALTSYFFFDAHRWRLPSVFILLLTSFSVVSFPILHNILATLFFASCLYPIWKLHRFRFYVWIYLLAVPIGFVMGLFWGEVFGVYVLCFYHIHIVMHMYKIGIRKRYHL